MSKSSFVALLVFCVGFLHTATAQVLLQENFDELDLGPFLDETLSNIPSMDNQKVWTKTAPEGWVVDDQYMPNGGVRDWHGWSFASAIAWAFVAGDQRRSEFTKGTGTVAIADPDEWDDLSHDAGTWEGYLSTPTIDITGATANSLTLTFDSSWRPESPQEANITVSFDGGDPQEILYWDSIDGDEFFHPDISTNETVTVEINNPANAKKMVLTWGVFNAGNNWFWAIDNVRVNKGNQQIYSEDFEGLPLGPFQDENFPSITQPIDNTKVWTDTPPKDWSVDNEYMPYDGVRDWSGWTFANTLAWGIVAGDQRRFEFTKSTGVAAIADTDEWDDLPHDDGTFESYLSTPAISLTGIAANTVVVEFDSSWRPEQPQEASLTVKFDNGDPQDLLYWSSIEDDPLFHPDTSTNESISIEVPNPVGAKSMTLTWGIFFANNNWFWAIDNVLVRSGQITQVGNWQLFE